jgi:hypothetical protein
MADTWQAPSSDTPGDNSNILNNYRSVNYNFTLAAISPKDLKDPASYRNKKLKYIIAASKGKGSNAISSDVVPIETNIIETETIREGGRVLATQDKVVGVKVDKSGGTAVESFNKLSPGALDLFIDGVEIESIVAPNNQTGVATSTKLRFEIFEPYSANGFIEAIHVAAVAAGWTGYLGAAYLLKIEFLGYPDNITDPVAEPETVKATKYIPIRLTGSEMEVTENGTRYRCSAIPFNEAAHSIPNQIFTDISFSGDNVGSVLNNLFENLNKSAEAREQKEKSADAARVFDKYEIYFPELPKEGQAITLDSNIKKNDIAGAKINENLRSNNIYKFPPIEESPNATPAGAGRGSADDPRRTDAPQPGTQKKTPQVQFSKGSNITEIIEAVIRDSHFLKEILEDVEKSKDSDGMISYFQIMINTIPGAMDTTTNQQKFTYQYIVVPYKVHFSRLPGQEKSKYKAENMKRYVKREYNYLYTGQNIDVLSFKLNFNNLFFQAAVPKMGNVDQSGTSDAAGAANTVDVKQPTGAAAQAEKSQLDVAATRSDPNASTSNGKGQSSQTDPYFKIAELAHNSILESVNLITGDIEILGDPFYLSTSGMGNYLPKLKDNAMTADGEASFNTGPVVVRINFRNPIDIDNTTGFVKFSDKVPFSGIYQVLKCRNSFRDGVFKQTLSIMRFPGQIENNPEKLKETPAFDFIEGLKIGEQTVIDAAPADVSKFGIKKNDINLSALGIKFPQVGSAVAQFKNASGLLGAGTSLLNQATAGIATGLNLAAGANSLLQGIPAGVDTLAKLATSNLSLNPAAALTQAGNIAASVIPGDPGSILSQNFSSSAANVINNAYNASANAGIKTSYSLNSALSSAKGLLGNPLATVSSLGDPSSFINNVGDKVSNITSILPSGETGGLTPTQAASVISDAAAKGVSAASALTNAKAFGFNLSGSALTPAAITAKLGIDASQLSGLTGKLDSKLASQVEELAKSIPANVDLNSVKDTGIVMANLAGDTLQNLPAMPLKLKAPAADLPARSFSSELSAEQRAAVITDATEKGIPVEQALRNAAMFGINIPNLSASAKAIALADLPQPLRGGLPGAGLNLPGVMDSALGKLTSVQKSLAGIVPGVGSLGSIENGISSVQQALGNPGSAVAQLGGLAKSVTSKFGSLTAAAAGPLDKLMNNAVNSVNNPNAAPYTGTDPIVRRRLGLPPIEEEA